MLRIGSTATGIDRLASHQVERAFSQLSDTSLKLATLKRINRGADDPAGLIAAEQLSRDLRALEEATEASERSRAAVHVADSGLARTGELLNDIEANLVAAANGALSDSERDALQIEIDAAVDAIDRIAATTRFGGRRVLDGEAITSLTGPNPSDVAELDLPEISSGSLGAETGRLADLRSGGSANARDGDLESAVEIVRGARQQVLEARAEAGAFERYTIDSTQVVLQDSIVNLSEARSQILDTNVATESANLVRDMILADSSILALGLTLEAREAAASLLGAYNHDGGHGVV